MLILKRWTYYSLVKQGEYWSIIGLRFVNSEVGSDCSCQKINIHETWHCIYNNNNMNCACTVHLPKLYIIIIGGDK